MDVCCERCKTEYEFDEARVTEAGVTVKCTSCGHVFKVKRKALAPDPVAPAHVNSHEPDMSSLQALAAQSALAPGERREWKVRQENGNVLTFRQLTTLQRWIVERKVTREDEISLTGEKWKRLGDIAELGIFFEVVDEAQKAKKLALGQTGAAETPLTKPAQEVGTRAGKLHSPAARLQSWRAPAMWLFVLLAVATVAGAGLYGYSTYLRAPLPEFPTVGSLAPSEPSEPVVAPTPPGSKVPSTAELVDRPAIGVNAGSSEVVPVDAGAVVTPAPRPAKAERLPRNQVKDFDWYMAQGDRLRDHQRLKGALNAYRLAAELDPNRAEPAAGKGYSLLDLGQKQQAEAAFREALRLNPRYAVAVMGLAETYRQLGKNAQAIEQYERYLEILPDGSEAPVARTAIERLKE